MKQKKKPTTVRLTPDNLDYCERHGTAATIDLATHLLHYKCYKEGLQAYPGLTIPKQATRQGTRTQIRLLPEVWDYCTLNCIPKSVFVNYAITELIADDHGRGNNK